MSHSLRLGLQVTKAHFKVMLLLFLYQCIWGFFLYRIVDQLLTPMLLRYPKITSSNELVQLFWLENQFRITKTDVLTPYLLSFVAILLVRMIITPLLQSGLFYSLFSMSQGEAKSSFIKGIKTLWKPMTLQYWIKNTLLLLPLLLFIRIITKQDQSYIISITEQPALLWIGYLVWFIIISWLFYIVQLGIGAQISPLTAVHTFIKYSIKLIAVAATLFAVFMFISLTVHTLSVFWVTFISFLLFQSLPLIRTFFKLWTIAAQYNTIYHQQIRNT